MQVTMLPLSPSLSHISAPPLVLSPKYLLVLSEREGWPVHLRRLTQHLRRQVRNPFLHLHVPFGRLLLYTELSRYFPTNYEMRYGGDFLLPTDYWCD